MKQKLSLLKTINHIFVDISKNGLKKPVKDVFKSELLDLSKYFKTTRTEAFFMVLIFGTTHKISKEINLNVLSDLLKWESIEILEYDELLEGLIKKQYLFKTTKGNKRSNNFSNNLYMINPEITDCIIKNKAIPDLKQKKFISIIDGLEELNYLSEDAENKLLGEQIFQFKLDSILLRNSHFSIFNKLKQLGITNDFQFIYYIIMWKTLTGGQELNLTNLVNKMRIGIGSKIKFIQNFVNPVVNKLLKHDLIDINLSEFINDSIVTLSTKSINLLEKENIA